MSTEETKFESCEAVGKCERSTVEAAGFHHFYYDAPRDARRMNKIFGRRGRGHDDPMSKYSAVVCKTCGLKALVNSDSEDFPEV